MEEGAWVRAGQPLAQLDDTLLRAQIAQQAAVTAQSQARPRASPASTARACCRRNRSKAAATRPRPRKRPWPSSTPARAG
ncbi:biotin/lipoyl-binding protein [Caulobacter sp. B11]|uniref:biotin/lipoyl-binding protein n=1 Tax=Caulobacter sp. B11 TaxID=2048899 RepID=UPI003514CC5C